MPLDFLPDILPDFGLTKYIYIIPVVLISAAIMALLGMWLARDRDGDI